MYFIFCRKYKIFYKWGFPKLIIDKKQQIKDKIDLCLDAYNNDLNKKFETSLIFIENKTMKCKLEKTSRCNRRR